MAVAATGGIPLGDIRGHFFTKLPSRRKKKESAQRLKRVFNIDITICNRCGGSVKIIVVSSNRCIEDPLVIKKILDHLDAKTGALACGVRIANFTTQKTAYANL